MFEQLFYVAGGGGGGGQVGGRDSYVVRLSQKRRIF